MVPWAHMKTELTTDPVVSAGITSPMCPTHKHTDTCDMCNNRLHLCDASNTVLIIYVIIYVHFVGLYNYEI